jgi:hypothetical protein
VATLLSVFAHCEEFPLTQQYFAIRCSESAPSLDQRPKRSAGELHAFGLGETARHARRLRAEDGWSDLVATDDRPTIEYLYDK